MDNNAHEIALRKMSRERGKSIESWPLMEAIKLGEHMELQKVSRGRQRMRDANVALVVLFTALFLGFFIGRVSAEEKTMINVPNQPEPSDRVLKYVPFENGDVLSLMTQIVDGSQIVEQDGTTAFKGREYQISRAMGCIYKIEIINPRDDEWTS